METKELTLAERPSDKRDKKTLHQLRADAIVQFHQEESAEDFPATVRLKKLLDKMKELNRRVDDLAEPSAAPSKPRNQ